ncbi:AraC-type DNA-binding protein [Epilithonimonas bovis DSM 19482]|jgi:AraC-like DNA-binding protein|uniref:AraC-type DNA-binding protein n=1 Tax=Epilithonimonas bovis DSM 19482 TaxID=1121284 RepID=A0A1U7PW59_9FLAO|nr:AraC family transcriptional regulator [Epilithonimonas bovis]SIT96734.1 AraC-type DNA-binding protein [Epilithonimonas bovis DSM 19482]
MKVILEHIQPDDNSSFKVLHIKGVPISELNWQYHYHSEIEIVCVKTGKGTRHVGYHKSHFEDGALALIGSNIPHSGFGLNATDPHEEIVIQFKEEILSLPENESDTAAIRKLLEISRYGVLFSSKVKQDIIPKLEILSQAEGYKRYLLLLDILFELSKTTDFELMNTEVMPYTIVSRNRTRLEAVFTYVENGYQNELDIMQAAELANLTKPAFCNFFKKATSITFVEFVNRYRIDKACILLSQEKSIAESCYATGFNNITYFNKIFKKYTKTTPGQFVKNL